MPDAKPDLVAQYQTLMVVWGGLLISQVMFLVVLFFIKKELFDLNFSQSIAGPNAIVTLCLAVLALACFAASFIIKARFFENALAKQDPALVQSGLIVACALCEACSLFGMLLAFAFDYQYFFFWFAAGILGILLHFPKQNDLLAAGYKS